MGGAKNSFIVRQPLTLHLPQFGSGWEHGIGEWGGCHVLFLIILKMFIFKNEHTVKLAVFLLAHSCLNFYVYKLYKHHWEELHLSRYPVLLTPS